MIHTHCAVHTWRLTGCTCALSCASPSCQLLLILACCWLVHLLKLLLLLLLRLLLLLLALVLPANNLLLLLLLLNVCRCASCARIVCCDGSRAVSGGRGA